LGSGSDLVAWQLSCEDKGLASLGRKLVANCPGNVARWQWQWQMARKQNSRRTDKCRDRLTQQQQLLLGN